MFRLDDKVAIVTGGGSGIGRAIAQAFAAQGATAIAADLDPAAAEETRELAVVQRESIHPERVDVTALDSVRGLFARVRENFGRVDILVNNAGISHVGKIQDTTVEDFDRMVAVNVKGVFLCAQTALEVMAPQRHGVILNMASIASLVGVKDRFAYSMTKGAVLTMTYSIAIDYVEQKIRCNAICPARIHTPFVDGFLAKNYPGREAEMFEKLSAYQPIGRMGKPEEVAALAVYLCSDEASFITGCAYPIDGGVLVQ